VDDKEVGEHTGIGNLRNTELGLELDQVNHLVLVIGSGRLGQHQDVVQQEEMHHLVCLAAAPLGRSLLDDTSALGNVLRNQPIHQPTNQPINQSVYSDECC
jgi:hypothetical protein